MRLGVYYCLINACFKPLQGWKALSRLQSHTSINASSSVWLLHDQFNDSDLPLCNLLSALLALVNSYVISTDSDPAQAPPPPGPASARLHPHQLFQMPNQHLHILFPGHWKTFRKPNSSDILLLIIWVKHNFVLYKLHFNFGPLSVLKPPCIRPVSPFYHH